MSFVFGRGEDSLGWVRVCLSRCVYTARVEVEGFWGFPSFVLLLYERFGVILGR